MVVDLPAGGRRLMQKARGYVATVKAGQVTYRHGVATGALSDPSLVQDDSTIQKCYSILGNTLRQYFSVYVHNCLDVRICPLDSVVTSDAVHAHMLAYVKANLSLEIDPEHKISYVDLLKVWLKESFLIEPNTEPT
jgi:hypothetical protein